MIVGLMLCKCITLNAYLIHLCTRSNPKGRGWPPQSLLAAMAPPRSDFILAVHSASPGSSITGAYSRSPHRDPHGWLQTAARLGWKKANVPPHSLAGNYILSLYHYLLLLLFIEAHLHFIYRQFSFSSSQRFCVYCVIFLFLSFAYSFLE